ncbi:MAG: type II toxin-antitoxin system HicA family toxin [Bacteroidota bacterium]|nr:type II toxin-antitoxin system HicA family toxin [Bacteroidota bacterium]
MSKLPLLSGRQVIKILQKIGYYIRDQKGSHIHLRHPIRPPLTITEINLREVNVALPKHLVLNYAANDMSKCDMSFLDTLCVV